MQDIKQIILNIKYKLYMLSNINNTGHQIWIKQDIR